MYKQKKAPFGSFVAAEGSLLYIVRLVSTAKRIINILSQSVVDDRVAQFGLEPSGLRRHNFAGVGNIHELF